MVIETGFDITNAIVNNPLESIVFFTMVIFAYKFFGIGDRHRRREVLHEFTWFWTYHVRYFLPRLSNNKRYSFCRMEVDCIDKVFMIIKTRYAFQSRQREIIHEQLGLGYDDINQIVDALISLGKIGELLDEKVHRTRLVPMNVLRSSGNEVKI